MTDFRMERIKQMLILLQKAKYLKRMPLDGWKVSPCEYKKDNTMPNKAAESFRDFMEDERWGKQLDTHAWFCNHISVPEDWTDGEVRFSIRTGAEGGNDSRCPQFIAYIDGKMIQGMDDNHTELYVGEYRNFDLDLYAYSGMNGILYEFKTELQLIQTDCEQLYYDLRVPMEILEFSEQGSKTYADVLRTLNEAINLMDCRIPGSKEFFASVRAAREYLKSELYSKYFKDQDTTVICVGHTHIDVAWLWTLDQTREKIQRSFSTVLQLMKRYPEYRFMSSQAQLYAYLKEESPETYEEVKKMVASGRWEVEGAMWVEADCNLSSGESLVRQILFGKRFFKDEFGVDSRVLWLPDVFGYSAALPQILKKSGVDRFVTSKISWSETNQMPYDMFRWRGIDGTEIFSWFLTAQPKKRGQKPVNYTTYVSTNEPAMIAGTWERFQQKEFADQAINTYGWGDGGGGPTAEMLEMRRRMENGIGECPNARIGTVTDFLNHVSQAENDPRLPMWSGELYLEFHRGTYTSIAKNKRNNRKSEFAYQHAEWMSSMGDLLLGHPYEQERLNKGWERILLYQFHDIIPGSSIKEVYEDCDRVYPLVLNNAAEISNAVRKEIANKIATDGGILVFNPHSFENSGIVQVNGTTRFVEHIPAKGYAVVQPKVIRGSVMADHHSLESDFLRIQFDDNYNIISIFDKTAKREVIDGSKGVGNQFEAYEDFPKDFDAWEISNYYKEKRYCINDVQTVELVKDGARAGIVITRKFLESTFTQTIWLYEDVKKIDFETEVDWKQEHLLVKTAFPVRINSDRATYEIQFGAVERPTHSNTSWDAAKFEVCSHKYCDYSEYGYGVAMLNDCKYGHDIHNGVMRLTMIKSATHPNPDADRCKHVFTYSLVPHEGDYRAAGVVQLAYDLNDPMQAYEIGRQEGTLKDKYSLVKLSRENVIMETVKKAENGSEYVMRFYEAYNQQTEVEVIFGFGVTKVYLCDLMENELEALPVRDNTVTLPIKPYEIITLKVK